MGGAAAVGRTPDCGQLVFICHSSAATGGLNIALHRWRAPMAMHWFRSNRRYGVYSALVALALQFALTFAHVHGVLPAPAAAAPVKLTALAALPDERPDTQGGAADFCAVCSLVQMASSSAPAAMPSTPLPALVNPTRLELLAGRTLAPSRQPLFQARAPPIA
jgi:hypothetical protein